MPQPLSAGVRRPPLALRIRAAAARSAAAVRRGFGAPPWSWLLVGSYVALYASWQLWRWLPGSQELVGDAFFLPLGAAFAVAAWRAGERTRTAPAVRKAWRITAVAALAFPLGEVAELVYEAVLHQRPYPTVADVFYLAMYPLMLIALLSFPTPRRERSGDAQRVLDSVIVGIAGAMLVWYVDLGPTALAGGKLLTLIPSVGYPVGDMILIAGAASVVLRGTVSASHDALCLIIAGLVLFVVGDLVYGQMTLHETYRGGDPVDTFWVVAQGLWVLAAFAQRPIKSGDLVRSGPGLINASWLTVPALGTALLLLLLMNIHRAFFPDVSIVIATMVMVGVISARQRLADRAQLRVRRELELIAALERTALESTDEELLRSSVLDGLTAHLGCSAAYMWGYEPELEQLRLVAAVGWPQSDVGHLCIPAEPGRGGYTLSVEGPVVFDDLLADPRTAGVEILKDSGMASAIGVRIGGRRAPYGVLYVLDSRKRRFSGEDTTFLETVAGVVSAATERQAAEEEIRRQAVRDGLTGLPNRVLFMDRLAYALAATRRHDEKIAVLFVDLDNFKIVNDSLGHQTGDELLKAAAQRLDSSLRPDDTLARLGGDEFAIILSGVKRPEDAADTARRLLSALHRPFSAGAEPRLMIAASVGIALADEESATPEVLLRNAELAMYAAKQAGRGGTCFFRPSMHEDALTRIELTGALPRALERGELSVRYQPIIDLDEGAVVGAEVLVRWEHPTRGTLGPGMFIPLAEESGLIDDLGKFVVDDACNQLRRWHGQPGVRPNLWLSVNVSAYQLRAPRVHLDVKRALVRTGVEPARLVLEITEGALLGSHVGGRLAELKALGVRIAIDDFGTGYAGLSSLQQLPADIVKIDKSFVDALGSSADSDELVAGIIGLAHRIGLSTVAEGIETDSQLRALRAMGAEAGQGFLFAKPLTLAEFEAVLHAPVPVGAPGESARADREVPEPAGNPMPALEVDSARPSTTSRSRASTRPARR